MQISREQAKAIIMQQYNMTEEEWAEKEQWAKDECICPDCPTFVAEESKLAFCWASIGGSDIITDEKNCVCGQCPVFNESKMQFAYFCTRDSNVEQRLAIGREMAADGGEEM